MTESPSSPDPITALSVTSRETPLEGERAVLPAGVDIDRERVGRHRAPARELDSPRGVAVVREGHRGDPHQAAIAGRARRHLPHERDAAPLILLEGHPGRDADVEAPP